MDHQFEIWIIPGRDGYTIGDEAYELLIEANNLCQNQEGIISVFLLGQGLEKWTTDLTQTRLMDNLFVFDSPFLKSYNPNIYLSIIREISQEQKPFLILASHTSMGKDLSPRIAYHLNGEYISNVQQIKLDATKKIEVIKPVYNGKVQGHFVLGGPPPWIVTLTPGVVGIKKITGSRSPKVIYRNIQEFTLQTDSSYKVCEFIKGDPKTIDLSEADIIVAGGRGLRDSNGFRLLETFSEKIGGSIGCTRPIVDENMMPLEKQIGQTGKTVSPYLLISCGISGAIQHTLGIKEAKHIVAINIDPKAPIFQLSELKIIADVYELLPVMIKKLGEWKKVTP